MTMKFAAAALLANVLAFAARAENVVIAVSAASDATSCATTGSIVAKGAENTVRAALQRGVASYRLDLAADSTWHIAAEVPGCWSRTLTWNAAGDAPLELHLERAGVVQGTLESRDVPAAVNGDLFALPDGRETQVRIDGIATQCVLDWPRWQCSVPASRVFDLRIHVVGYAPLFFWDVRVAAGETSRLAPRRLEKGASVAGWVEDPNGAPQNGARVSLVALEAAPSGATAKQRSSARTLQTRTNAKGFFQFAGVAPGSYRAISEAKGVSPASTAEIRVRPDDAVTWPLAMAHVLPPALVVTVQPSTDPRGEPWVAQFVEREPLFPDRNEPIRQQVSESGLLAIGNLHASAYEIEIRDAEASIVAIAEVDLSSGGEHTLPIDIRGIAATGTLRCGDEPLEAELTFTNLTGRSIRAKTDADGRFEVSFPTAGVWQTELRYPLAARASMISLEPVDIRAGATTTLDVRVPGGRIKGRVTGAGGAGEQAAVHVRARGRIVAQLVTETDGTFDIVGIPAGTYAVDAEGRSGTTRTGAPVTIEKHETQNVHLRLEPNQRIRGVIRTPAGAPASGATVRISADRGRSWIRTVTDVRGTFEYSLPGDTDDVQLIVLTYSYPALTLRAAPTASSPLEITLPATGGILRVDGGEHPVLQTSAMRVPLRFLYFPAPFGRHGGGVHLPTGTYLVCPDNDPRAQCKSATIAPSSEAHVEFPPRQRAKENE